MSDRKYVQRGYQSDDRPQARRQQGPPPERKEGPRGRGLGAPQNEVFRCRDCGTERPIAAIIELDTTCHNCGRALHSCVNCTHFDTSARFECRKPIPARLPSKTKANSCELYAQKIAVESDGRKSDSPADPRAAFDALFR
jgi:hypothetical protein